VRNKKRTAHAKAQAQRLRQRQQRWARLAALWGKPFEERTPQEIDATRIGICYSIRVFHFPRKMRIALLNGFMRNDPASNGDYLGPTREQYNSDPDYMDSIRATLCAFFAIMGRRDRGFFFNGEKA
jgi:hypothetical protein